MKHTRFHFSLMNLCSLFQKQLFFLDVVFIPFLNVKNNKIHAILFILLLFSFSVKSSGIIVCDFIADIIILT